MWDVNPSYQHSSWRAVPSGGTAFRSRHHSAPAACCLFPEKMLFPFALSGLTNNPRLWPSAAAGVNYFSLPGSLRRPVNSIQDCLWQKEEDLQPSREMRSGRTIWCGLCRFGSSRVTVPMSQISKSLRGKRIRHCHFLRVLPPVTVTVCPPFQICHLQMLLPNYHIV